MYGDVNTVGGAKETNGLGMNGSEYHSSVSNIRVSWNDKRLKRITRLRLLSDPGYPYWDVSYIHGELHDGTSVHIHNPFPNLTKRGLKAEILAAAKRDKVYAKGLGVFEAISTLS